MANTFPTSLNDFASGETIESAWADSLEAKIGVDSSAVTTSLDYLVKSASSADPGHKHPASKIVNTPAGGIAATTVQAAIDELDTEKAPLASPTFTGTVTVPVGLTGVLRADTGVVSVDSDVTDIVAAASLTAAGKVELATTAEIDTGTDTTRAIPVDQFVASARNVRYVLYRVLGSATSHTVSTAVGGDLEVPFTGTITNVGVFFDTAGVTGLSTVDINKAGTTILSTKITVDSTEKTSRTAVTAPVISVSAVTAGDILTFDIDGISTTAALGLTIRLEIRQS